MIDVQIDYGYADDSVICALERLVAVDSEFDFASMEKQWRRRGSFSPKQMLLIQWRLSVNSIVHDPKCFSVSTDSDKEIAQIRSLSDWQKHNLAPYLSWAQRSRFGF